MNFTAIGSIAVLIWGFSLPLGRVVQEQIGPVAYLGSVFFFTGLLSLARQKFSFSLKARERAHPALYLRWAFFVMHEALISLSVGIVSLKHMPIVILINYLWPTAIIVCSILIANVRIFRKILFLTGTSIVVASLSFELVGGAIIGADLFDHFYDNVAFGLTFLGAISWGLYCAITKQYGHLSGEARPTPLFQLTLGLALPLSFLPQFNHGWNLNQLGLFILCGTRLAQAVAYYCWDAGMRLGNIVILRLLADFIPWLSLFGTTLLLDVQIGPRTALSALCLVLGAIVTRFATTAPKAQKLAPIPTD
jgi:drug/metabolite transporter (DMT)-like permease